MLLVGRFDSFSHQDHKPSVLKLRNSMAIGRFPKSPRVAQNDVSWPAKLGSCLSIIDARMDSNDTASE